MSGLYVKENITPDHLRCGGGTCPSVYVLSDGQLLIVGKRAPAELVAAIENRVGADEVAVIIGAEYLKV